jgi:AmiR/NasT family two-component response regulator
MNRDDIIAAASKAGFETKRDMIWVDKWEITPTLTRFTSLVAAAEREACIECIGRIAAYTVDPIDRARLYEAMDAIRARGKK